MTQSELIWEVDGWRILAGKNSIGRDNFTLEEHFHTDALGVKQWRTVDRLEYGRLRCLVDAIAATARDLERLREQKVANA